MEDRAKIFGKAIDVLTGQKERALAWELQAYLDGTPFPEIRRRKLSDGRKMSETMAREFFDRVDAAHSILTDVGEYQELRINVGLPTIHAEELKAIMDDLDPGGVTSTPAAFRPAMQRDELLELQDKIKAVRTCYAELNWATVFRLDGAMPSQRWKYLDTMLKKAAAATEVAKNNVPNLHGGRVASYVSKQLVEFCSDTFNDLKPGKISTTAGGNFSDYVSAIHSLATGERNIDFGQAIREVLKLHRAGKRFEFFKNPY